MRVGAIFFDFFGAGAVRCEFFKILWCWCGAVRVFQIFLVLVRCGANFSNFLWCWCGASFQKFCGAGAVRSEFFSLLLLVIQFKKSQP